MCATYTNFYNCNNEGWKKILKDYWKSYSDLGGTFLENLQGLTTLKVFNIDEDRHEKINVESENFRKITMKVLSMQLNSITKMEKYKLAVYL